MKILFLLFCVLFAVAAQAEHRLQVNVLALTGANDQDVERIDHALELLEEVVNREEFREALLGMTYKIGKRTYKGFSQTSLNREEILSSILNAEENFNGGSQGMIDLNLDMYSERSSTVGYTSPSDKFIHMNRYIQADFSSMKTAGNIFHEWLHKLNHKHSQRSNKYRPHSVPYKLGYLVASMAAEIESKGNPMMKEMLMHEFVEGSDCDKSMH